MGFLQWYLRRGRIDRRTWWLQYTLPLAVLALLGLSADVSMGNTDLSELAAGGSPYGPFVIAVVLLMAPASLSSSATRLHDRGLPAWWLLVGLVPYLGELALFVLNGFLPGTPGPNRYGPPPGTFPPPVVRQSPPPFAPPSGPPVPPPSAPPYWG